MLLRYGSVCLASSITFPEIMETGKRKITENFPCVMPQALPRVPGYCSSISSLQEKCWFVFATGNYFPRLDTSDTNCG